MRVTVVMTDDDACSPVVRTAGGASDGGVYDDCTILLDSIEAFSSLVKMPYCRKTQFLSIPNLSCH